MTGEGKERTPTPMPRTFSNRRRVRHPSMLAATFERESRAAMRAVIQRVHNASVTIDERRVSEIGRGLVVFAGIAQGDADQDLQWMVRKIVELRVFNDDEGKMNRSLQETGADLLLVSQFTLLGDCRKGRRPSYSEAAPPDQANRLFRQFVEQARGVVPAVQTGRFQAMMQVHLTNDGPVTLILDSKNGR